MSDGLTMNDLVGIRNALQLLYRIAPDTDDTRGILRFADRMCVVVNNEIDDRRREIENEAVARERAVWAAWNELPDDCESPVKTISRDLGLDPVHVGSIVFPEKRFGGPYNYWEEPDPS